MKFFAKRVGYALVPDGTESQEDFDKIPRGKTLKCEATQPRNLKMHRLFFKLCQRIGAAIGQDTEWVEKAFKVELEHFDVFEYGGKTHMVLRSIAFDKMDQTVFSQWFERCIEIMYRRWKIDPASVADLLVREEDQKR